MNLTKHTFLLTCTALLAFPIQAAELISPIDDQSSVAVTIYNNNLALIKDRRNIELQEGTNQIAFRGVSAMIRPETALLRDITHPGGLRIIEQNFDFDLLTPQSLINKFVNRTIRVATTNPATGKESIEQATVLSTNDGVILKIGDRIETQFNGRYIFDNIPSNLRDQPTLSTMLDAKTAGEQEIELSYLSKGLSWKADYVAELSADDKTIDLLGWVTLNNQSGTTYNQASMQLVAGDVNQVQPDRSLRMESAPMQMVQKSFSDNAMQEESLFEYHLYTLSHPTSIAHKQIKQVSLLTASSIPVTKQYLLQGQNYYYNNRFGLIGDKLKTAVFVEFENKQTSGLGVPLPKGIVRVYKQDSKARAQFVGEDRIHHTPKNESVRLKLGDAFDVTASKKQTAFRIIKRNKHSNITESSFEVVIKNAKSEPVTVTLREPIPGEWQIINTSHPHDKTSSKLAEWNITVAPESSATLTYTAKVSL